MKHAFLDIPVNKEIINLAEMAGESLHAGQFDNTTKITREAMDLDGWTLVRVLTENKASGNMSDDRHQWNGFSVYVHTDGRSVRYNSWEEFQRRQWQEDRDAEVTRIRAQFLQSQADQVSARLDAVARINAALEALEEEGCAVNARVRQLRISKKGEVDYNRFCEDFGQFELSRKAVALCAEFPDQTELEDEVASIIGVLAE